jgi:hypothetical protein
MPCVVVAPVRVILIALPKKLFDGNVDTARRRLLLCFLIVSSRHHMQWRR